jgi:hypothetical protein
MALVDWRQQRGFRAHFPQLRFKKSVRLFLHISHHTDLGLSEGVPIYAFEADDQGWKSGAVEKSKPP